MFLTEYLVAALLVAATPSNTMPAPPVTSLDLVRSSLLQNAVDAEILDPREEQFWQASTSAHASDLEELNRRQAALGLMPRLAEAERLPCRKHINDLLGCNRAYRNDLLNRLAVDVVHAEELRHAVAETDQLYRIWEAARDARCDFYYVTVRRQALQTLLDLVGEDAFYRGELPPALPYWHFPRAR